MINIPLSDLHKYNFYEQTLQVIEDLCEEYQLNNSFGVISMANQVVADYLQGVDNDPLLEVNFQINSEDLSIQYAVSDQTLSGVIPFDEEQFGLLGKFCDNVEYNSDNKSLTFTFLVKPKLNNVISHTHTNIMNKKVSSKVGYYLTLLMILISSITVSAQKYNVLFIGNSYTSVNDLPQMIKKVALSAGDTLTYYAHVPGGCTFNQHVTSAAQYIQQGGWDWVVLQEQSQLPSFPPSQFMNECYPFAQELCNMIRQYNPNSKIAFYMTWGRKYGDEQNCQYYPPLCTYEGMDSLLYARYMIMAQDNNAYVSPVGRVWHTIRDNYPNIELYQSDNSHPSLSGSYAAACSFYSLLFQKNPSNITDDCSVDAGVASTIRQVVTTQVYDSLNKWMFIADTNTISVEDYESSSLNVYPNPANNTIQIQYSFTDESSIEVTNMQGQLLYISKPGSVNVFTLDISSLEDGLYFVRITEPGNVTSVRKFIKSSL